MSAYPPSPRRVDTVRGRQAVQSTGPKSSGQGPLMGDDLNVKQLKTLQMNDTANTMKLNVQVWNKEKPFVIALPQFSNVANLKSVIYEKTGIFASMQYLQINGVWLDNSEYPLSEYSITAGSTIYMRETAPSKKMLIYVKRYIDPARAVPPATHPVAALASAPAVVSRPELVSAADPDVDGSPPRKASVPTNGEDASATDGWWDDAKKSEEERQGEKEADKWFDKDLPNATNANSNADATVTIPLDEASAAIAAQKAAVMLEADPELTVALTVVDTDTFGAILNRLSVLCPWVDPLREELVLLCKKLDGGIGAVELQAVEAVLPVRAYHVVAGDTLYVVAKELVIKGTGLDSAEVANVKEENATRIPGVVGRARPFVLGDKRARSMVVKIFREGTDQITCYRVSGTDSVRMLKDKISADWFLATDTLLLRYTAPALTPIATAADGGEQGGDLIRRQPIQDCGFLLQDSKLLCEYFNHLPCDEVGETHVDLQLCVSLMRISIVGPQEQAMLSLDVIPSMSIMSVKRTIQTHLGIPIIRQTLLYPGPNRQRDLELSESRMTLRQYGIRSNSSLLLLVQETENAVHVFVHTVADEMLTLEVHPHDKLSDLKAAISEVEGTPVSKQILYVEPLMIVKEGETGGDDGVLVLGGSPLLLEKGLLTSPLGSSASELDAGGKTLPPGIPAGSIHLTNELNDCTLGMLGFITGGRRLRLVEERISLHILFSRQDGTGVVRHQLQFLRSQLLSSLRQSIEALTDIPSAEQLLVSRMDKHGNRIDLTLTAAMDSMSLEQCQLNHQDILQVSSRLIEVTIVTMNTTNKANHVDFVMKIAPQRTVGQLKVCFCVSCFLILVLFSSFCINVSSSISSYCTWMKPILFSSFLILPAFVLYLVFCFPCYRNCWCHKWAFCQKT